MVNRWVKCALIGLWGLGVAGCWDRVEIEQRGFVVGIAVEKAEDGRFVLTDQFVNPEAMQGGGKSSGGKEAKSGGGGGKPMLNISSEGKTLLAASRDMAAKTSRTPYIEHLKMIIVSERIAEEGLLGPVLDLYLRDNEARRGTKIFVSQGGDPRDALEIDPQNEKLPVMFIDSIAGNTHKNGMMMRQVRIGEVHGMLLTNESFAIPRMNIRDKQVKLIGAAVIRGYRNRMVGFLDGQETEALNYLTEHMKSDVIVVPTKSGLVSYESKRIKRKVTAKVKDPEHIEFTITIRSEGFIGESLADYNYKKPQVIAEVQRKAEERIEDRCRQLIDKLQHQYHADILGLGKHLYHYHPKAWKHLKSNWDYGENHFSNSVIKVNVIVKVREFGAIRKVQKYRVGG